jgi:type VI secretion system secreted protein VgrG
MRAPGGLTQVQVFAALPAPCTMVAASRAGAETAMSRKPITVSSFPNLATIGGGHGSVPAWVRPDLIFAAPAGIGSHTPASAIYSAGTTASLSAGQDIQHTVQANHALVAKDGLLLFTYGKAQSADKPNQEVGLQLHAASGNVNLQSQSAATKLTADKAVEVASTHGMVRITAPAHVLLTVAGAAVELKGGNITLKGPGKVEFKASIKELSGPGSAQVPVLNFPRPTLDLQLSATYPVSL